MKVLDVAVFSKRIRAARLVIRITGRNIELARGGPGGYYFAFRPSPWKRSGLRYFYLSRLAIGRVVNLEDQIGALLDQLCLSRTQNQRSLARNPAYKPAVRIIAAIRTLVLVGRARTTRLAAVGYLTLTIT